tara:strand:- start:1545 stop:2018 length:474 start_codon:yes stop_codon:yes gene_type:complete
MIDPISCIAVITSASGAISSAIKAGKDISSLSVPLQRYAKAEAELNFGAQRKKNSFLAKFTGAESTAIDRFFKQEELKQARDKLRETFMLYGKMSQWQSLQKMIAEERAEYRRELQRKAEFRDTLYTIFGVIVIGIVFIAGALGIVFLAKYLKEQQA